MEEETGEFGSIVEVPTKEGAEELKFTPAEDKTGVTAGEMIVLLLVRTAVGDDTEIPKSIANSAQQAAIYGARVVK